MAKESFLGNGWAYPVTIGENGKVAAASDIAAIERSIRLILGTAQGERLMRPSFGSRLHSFVFRPLNAANRGRIATTVQQALMAWEPRIRVRGVEVTVAPDEPTTARIDISYEVRSSSVRANLVYPFYAGGA